MSQQNGTTDLALPVFPAFKFDEEDYSRLRMRLDLYSDMITATRYSDEGRPVEVYALDPNDVATAMSLLPLGSGLLPPGCLFWGKVGGQERLGIFVEPKIWPVSVVGEKMTWYVPMPGLVFIGQGTAYNLYAVKEEYWPTANTPLYNAPCPNIGIQGVCSGNAPFPAASPATIWQAVEVFFTSGFNNHLDNRKSKKFNDSILKMWRALHEAGVQEYPLDDLVSTNLTLAQVVKERGSDDE